MSKVFVPRLVSGIRANFIRIALIFFLFRQVSHVFRNPFKAWKQLSRMRKKRAAVHGNVKITKFVNAGDKYFWVSDNFAFPSENLKTLIKNEAKQVLEVLDEKSEIIPLQTVIWGITNRCMLNCKHCYDWENIDKQDHLSLDELKEILAKIMEQGIRHIQLSGGEPLVRFNDLISLVKEASGKVDFWLLTSGFGLTYEKATELKNAGLTGVNISLDHWNPTNHNNFRNHSNSFQWVEEAVENSRNAGLLVSLSLCATREFTTRDNLNKYAELAKNLKVHFLRILEARQVGNFKNKQVELLDSQISLLTEFTLSMNADKKYSDYPIVVFYGNHQRKLGCHGSGRRYLYIDSNGEIHACPFCQGSVGNILEMPLNEAIVKLRARKCHVFKMFSIPEKNG